MLLALLLACAPVPPAPITPAPATPTDRPSTPLPTEPSPVTLEPLEHLDRPLVWAAEGLHFAPAEGGLIVYKPGFADRAGHLTCEQEANVIRCERFDGRVERTYALTLVTFELTLYVGPNGEPIAHAVIEGNVIHSSQETYVVDLPATAWLHADDTLPTLSIDEALLPTGGFVVRPSKPVRASGPLTLSIGSDLRTVTPWYIPGTQIIKRFEPLSTNLRSFGEPVHIASTLTDLGGVALADWSGAIVPAPTSPPATNPGFEALGTGWTSDGFQFEEGGLVVHFTPYAGQHQAISGRGRLLGMFDVPTAPSHLSARVAAIWNSPNPDLDVVLVLESGVHVPIWSLNPLLGVPSQVPGFDEVGWEEVTLDLTPWAGQRVAFLATTPGRPPGWVYVVDYLCLDEVQVVLDDAP